MKRNSYLIGEAFKNYLTASILTVAATQIANIADASIVGNLIGPEALAAVNLSKPVLQAIYAISVFYISSTTMMVGIAIGKGDKTKANKLFTFSMLTSLLLGVALVVGGIAGFDSLSQILCNSDTLRPMTNDFLRVAVLSSVPQLLMYTFHQFVTVDGSPKLITRAVIVGNIFNILCDILFIKYFGWGISGAAWATFIMYIVCVLMVLPHFRKKGTLRLSLPKFGDIDYKQIATYGFPLFISTVLMSVQFVSNNYVASTYLGDDGLIALAVCIQLLAFSMIILAGILRTIQPVGSILKGLGDDRGMLFLLKKAYIFLAICLTAFALMLVVFPSQISALLGATNEGALNIIMKALPLFSLNIIMHALLCNLVPVYQFYGHKNLALILSFGQTLLPMFGFWLLQGGWIGFFLGQAVVAVVILICTAVIRSKDKSLTPVFLIPRGEDKDVYDVTIDTTIASLGESTNDMLAFLQTQGLSRESSNKYVLCAEELLKNIIDHGHAKYVDIRATKSIISIHDDGKPFNPLEYKGEGFGLKIVNGIGTDMKYDYRFNQNMITIMISNN
ncbi:MAG: polysaccharide biosynthesis C-terminal domain-containing protein [Bacteroidaceae bacterium]|nr:polysaccharide biosynthesis C-terminal domain-containing protein [Bacteroidaceae bacterium]